MSSQDLSTSLIVDQENEQSVDQQNVELNQTITTTRDKSYRTLLTLVIIISAVAICGIVVFMLPTIQRAQTVHITWTEELQSEQSIDSDDRSINQPDFSSNPPYKSFFSNTEPRRDVDGMIMDVHDGDILYHRGVYYYYGTMYGECAEINSTSGCDGRVFGESCGWRYNHNVSLYTSVDLATWKRASEPPFQMARDFPVPQTVLFCSKVIYNTITHEFVMWLNWNTASDGFIAIAASSSPFGPFEIVVKQLNTLERAWPSDFGLFQDHDGVGYVIYSAQHVVNIETLTTNFYGTLGSKNSSALIGPMHVEAPALFKRKGVYYASTGAECCYCAEGSAAVLYAAPHPLGPYVNVTVLSAVTSSQQTDITRFWDQNGEEQFMYRGDMWQHAPDHIKGHDPSYFGLIQWINDLPQPLVYQSNFTLLIGSGNYTN